MKSWIRSSGKWDAERCSRAPRLAAALLFMLGVSMPVALNSEQCLPAVNRYYGYSFMHPLMIEPRQPGAAPTKRSAPRDRPRAYGTPACTTAKITAALRHGQWLWRLFPALILALPATLKGSYGRVLP